MENTSPNKLKENDKYKVKEKEKDTNENKKLKIIDNIQFSNPQESMNRF